MSETDIVKQAAKTKETLTAELRKVIVGQQDVLDELLITLLARGHTLLTGVPGLGKTLLIKTLSKCLSLSFKRIQFTPDLMPSDIVGTEVFEEDSATRHRTFRFLKGPVFANIVLADEINRTPPKTQAALLEAMEERQVTAAGDTHPLEQPFFVLATQNPIELEGTYPLPEAQLDRFLLNSVIDFLPPEEEMKMVAATTSPAKETPQAVLDAEEIQKLQESVREIPVSDHVVSYAVRLAVASRPREENPLAWVRKEVKWGAGSRASQALILAGKARALLDGRVTVAIEDIRAMAKPALRHRILPSFYAESENISSDTIIDKLLAEIPENA
jgi:MoxR-like ATPase